MVVMMVGKGGGSGGDDGGDGGYVGNDSSGYGG